MKGEYDIRCAKHPDRSLGIVFTDNASAWCPTCKRWIGTTGDFKSAIRKPTNPRSNRMTTQPSKTSTPLLTKLADDLMNGSLGTEEAPVDKTAAKAEHAAIVAWAKAGSEGDRPAAPNYDRLQQEHGQKGTTMPTKKSTRAPRAPRTPVRYVCDGRVMPDNQNRLSSVAYQYTNGVKKGERRIGSADLLALLKKLGVEDPKAPGWKVELPNGVTVEARRMHGSVEAPARKPAADKPAPAKATKAPAKTAAAKKAAPKKTAARKTAARKTAVKA